MNNPALYGLIAAIVGSLCTYFLAARKLSGKIQTSEASSLWEEAGKLRREYRDEIADLKASIRGLEMRIAEMENDNRDLVVENAQLKRTVALHERTILALNEEVEGLRADNTSLRKENNEMSTRLGLLEQANDV